MRGTHRLAVGATAARTARANSQRLAAANTALQLSLLNPCPTRAAHFRATRATAPAASHKPRASGSKSESHAASASACGGTITLGTHSVQLNRTLPLSMGGLTADGSSNPGLAHLAAPLCLNLFDSAAEDLDGLERALQKPVILVCPSMSHSALVTRGEKTRAREDAAAAAAAASGTKVAAVPAPGPKGWWEGVVGRGPSFGIDLAVFRVVCASPLGGPFGSTSPLSPNPSAPDGRAYRADFPIITPLDQARLHSFCLDHLQIERVHAVVGSSMGGMAALQFARHFPRRYERVVAICTTAQSSASTQALRAVQRAAVRSDPLFAGGNYADHGDGAGPVHGLSIARMFGTICYRSREEFDHRFDHRARHVALQCAASRNSGPEAKSAAAAVASAPNPVAAALASASPAPAAASASAASGACPPLFEVESFLHHAAASFTGRYDANCYLSLSTCMDLMDIAQPAKLPAEKPAPSPLHVSYDHGCAQIPTTKQVMLLPIATDALIPPAELERLGSVLGSQGVRVHVERVHSLFGHDAFLKDHHTFNPRLAAFLDPHHPDGVQHVRQFVGSLMI